MQREREFQFTGHLVVTSDKAPKFALSTLKNHLKDCIRLDIDTEGGMASIGKNGDHVIGGVCLDWDSLKETTGFKVLDKPLSMREVVVMSNADKHGYIGGVIRMDLSDFIDNDLEGVLDIMSERLTACGLLSDIEYTVVGHEDNELLVMVRGSVDSIETFPWDLHNGDEVTIQAMTPNGLPKEKARTFIIGEIQYVSDEVIRIRPRDSGDFIEVNPDDIR